MKKLSLYVFLVLMFCDTSFADSLRVVDGDTIKINGERIRFSGIDAPESYYRGKKQFCYLNEEKIDCANLSKLQLKEKIGANPISCEREKDKDFFGRTVA